MDDWIDCECSDFAVVPGTLWPWDTWGEYGVERHDECDQFPSDIHAALAVARAIGAPTITLRWYRTFADYPPLPRPFVFPPPGYPDPYARS